MLGLGTLLSTIAEWNLYFSNTLGITELSRGNLNAAGTLDATDTLPVSGLQLTHVVVGDHKAFALNGQATDPEIHVARDHQLRARIQRVPRFVHHTSPEMVEVSWRNELARKRPFAAGPRAPGIDRRDPQQWQVDSVLVPDVTDQETVLTLAKLAANAYVPTPFEGDWSDVNGTDGWNHEGSGYGWDDDTLRGYVFTTADRSAMVLSIKGTSTAVWDSGGPTAPNDKINDNLFFSCCCARVSRMWNTVCDCYMDGNQCDEICLEEELWREDRYYRQVLEVYADARRLVPEATTVWITGHSLGGALSSMLGRTFGLPAVTFEAPGEDLPVHRLHLPVPPGLPPWEDHVWHFGHNADPIFMGSCDGSGSTCSMKGYAMETKCHSGLVCLYDVKNDLGWRESIVNHRIHVVIDNVLEVYDTPAVCLVPEYCEDCINWGFVDSYDRDPPSESSTSASAAPSPPTSGPPTAHPTTPSTTSKPSTTPPTTAQPTTTEYTSSCLSRGWFGRCDVWTSVPVTPPPTSTPSSSCVKRNWFGQCETWSTVAPTDLFKLAFATNSI